MLAFLFFLFAKTMYVSAQSDVQGLSPTHMRDGVYTGSSDFGLVKVELEVTVQEGAFSDIRIITHEQGMGKPAEALLPIIIETNSTKVDTISGATISSKAILHTIEDIILTATTHDNTET